MYSYREQKNIVEGLERLVPEYIERCKGSIERAKAQHNTWVAKALLEELATALETVLSTVFGRTPGTPGLQARLDNVTLLLENALEEVEAELKVINARYVEEVAAYWSTSDE